MCMRLNYIPLIQYSLVCLRYIVYAFLYLYFTTVARCVRRRFERGEWACRRCGAWLFGARSAPAASILVITSAGFEHLLSPSSPPSPAYRDFDIWLLTTLVIAVSYVYYIYRPYGRACTYYTDTYTLIPNTHTHGCRYITSWCIRT